MRKILVVALIFGGLTRAQAQICNTLQADINCGRPSPAGKADGEKSGAPISGTKRHSLGAYQGLGDDLVPDQRDQPTTFGAIVWTGEGRKCAGIFQVRGC